MPLLLETLRAPAMLTASALLLVTVSGCQPFVYCGECGVHPDAALIDAPVPVDAGMDMAVDAPSIDVGMDGGPPPIPHPLDGTTLPSRVCSLGGWCWLSPQVPPEVSWSDVAAFGTEAWVVTEDAVDHVTPGGAILHFDGTTWSGIIGRGAHRVAGSGPSDVWFLSGDHDLLHWDGTMFGVVTITASMLTGGPGIVRDLGSSSGDDLWVVGDGGLFLHYDGTSWSAANGGVGIRDLRSVHVAAAGDIWVGGAAGVVRHFDTDWEPIDAPSDFDVDAIWAPMGATADGQQSAWIGGVMGARYWDVAMSMWRTPTGASIANIRAISGSSVSDVYMLSSDGTDFDAFHTSIVPIADGSPECARVAIAPFGANQYLRVGSRVSPGMRACSIDLMSSTTPGVDGTSPGSSPFGAVRSVAPLTDDDLLVYAADAVYTGSPSTMTFTRSTTLLPTGVMAGTVDIEAARTGDVWIDAHDGADTRRHWDGMAWTMEVPSAGASRLVFASSASQTWVAADADVFAWHEGAFVAHGTLADPVVALALVEGTDAVAAWAIHGSALAHYDGTTWMDVATTSLPSDCAPLVARGTDAVECLSTGGRYRFMLDGSGGVIMPATGVPTYVAGEARALIGERAWMFARGASGEADERILWSDLDETWNARSSGWAGDGTLHVLATGTTWRVTNGSLLEWRPR